MKTMLAISAVAAGALAAFSVAQWQTNSRLHRQAALLAQESQEKAAQIQELTAAREKSECQRAELLQTTAELAEQIRTQRLAVVPVPAPTRVAAVAEGTTNAGTKPDKAGLGGFLSKMMQDPDTKKFIREQQRAMMDQMYAPLVKRLGLSTEEATQFKDMLSENAMKAAEKATSIFGAPATDRAELASSIAAEQKAFDEQIKTFLGEERFGKFQEYQETVGDRTQLNQFRQQHPSDYPITDAQVEQLLTLTREERKSVAAATGQNAVPGPDNQQNFQAMLSPAQAEKLLQGQETVNQRVYERARMVLSPEQLQTFGAYQANQMQTMRLGFGMMRKLLNGEQTQANAAGPSGNP